MKRLSAAGVLAAALLAGCTSEDPEPAAAPMIKIAQSAADVLAADSEVHKNGAGTTAAVDIKLSGASASSSGKGVAVQGSTVTVTAAGTYRISGTLTGGRIVVDAPDATVTLVLAGARITSSGTAAIDATEPGQLVVSLAGGSTNTLTGGLAAAGDLTLTGTGALTVTGDDAISAQGGLLLESGTITVTAKDDGISGENYLVVSGGTVKVTATGDGLRTDNEDDAEAGFFAMSAGSMTVTAGGDGVDAATDLVLTGGTLTVTSGGGNTVAPAGDKSAKGLESGVLTILEGGTATVSASDDAVHSDGSVRVNGATLTVATGDDGLHAEQALQLDSGTVEVTTSVEALEAAHVLVNGGDITVTSSDDGLNAAGGTGEGTEEVGDFSAVITGGTLVINADGDGLDSNGTASITGGTVVVNGPGGRGNGALDVNGSFTISGGVLVAAGSASMPVAPGADSAQGWLSVTLDAAVRAGTTLQVVDGDDKALVTFVTSKEMQNLVYSSPEVTNGEEYTIRSGGTASGANTGGLAAAGTLGSARIATGQAGEAPPRRFGR